MCIRDRSNPLTRSDFKDDESERASKTTAGLRLANRSRSFLNLSKAASGLLSLSTLSHLAPPTAPNILHHN